MISDTFQLKRWPVKRKPLSKQKQLLHPQVPLLCHSPGIEHLPQQRRQRLQARCTHGRHAQAHRFVPWVIGPALGAPVHRHHATRLDVGGGLRGLFGEHVVVAPAAVVLAVLDEGDAQVRKASAHFCKVRAVGRIAL